MKRLLGFVFLFIFLFGFTSFGSMIEEKTAADVNINLRRKYGLERKVRGTEQFRHNSEN